MSSSAVRGYLTSGSDGVGAGSGSGTDGADVVGRLVAWISSQLGTDVSIEVGYHITSGE